MQDRINSEDSRALFAAFSWRLARCWWGEIW